MSHAKLIDVRKNKNEEPLLDSDIFVTMHNRGGRWAVYQNHDLGHSQLGHLCCLRFGEGCTYALPPARYPDTPERIGWRYQLVGEMDFKTGEVISYEGALHGEPLADKSEGASKPSEGQDGAVPVASNEATRVSLSIPSKILGDMPPTNTVISNT